MKKMYLQSMQNVINAALIDFIENDANYLIVIRETQLTALD